MNPASPAHDPALHAVQFIDHHSVRWSSVCRTCYVLHKRFHYSYPGPIRNLRQRLIVVPPEQHGDQRLREHELRVVGAAGAVSTVYDMFGNRVLFFEAPEVQSEIAFEVDLLVERAGYPDTLPLLSAEQVAPFRAETALTASDVHIQTAAEVLARQHREPLELAVAINRWVAETMRYGWGVTNVSTPAAEALRLGQGLCQDYAHIMLSLCRCVGLPARYVSGHLLGEGGSHAWVEVLLPAGDRFAAVPFDPTNHRRGNLSYVTIAVGCDYQDVSPTSGRFSAPYQGQLTTSKRAGLVRVEYA
jgi:transglutaminase-like putative cysteine protease